MLFTMARALSLAALTLLVSASRADWVVSNLTPSGMWDASIYAVSPANQFGTARSVAAPAYLQPLMWSGSSAAWTSLASPGTGGVIYAADATHQVGAGGGGGAALWSGSASTLISLHPPGLFYSEARAISGANQFGYTIASITAPLVAAKWSGSAASYISMNPPSAPSSSINAAWADQQGGTASFGTSLYPQRAGLWTGTAASFINIHPGAYLESYISGMGPGEQVGSARAATTFNHAALWHGTAQSFVDLDPGFGYSGALATIGGVQAGFANTTGGTITHAGLWFGSASSFLDLSQFLPAGYFDSVATSIATDGSSYFVGGYGTSPTTGYRDAFLWVGSVPSPPGLALLATAGLLAVRRHRP